ncbi:MAG: hypothetical protein DME04_16740 [Candidatus Rokuibacteriota bacterium]|nr:MAG: hypothetical protein DME04_16740 [Candidatus Rokubacteria bacterium]
MSAVLFTTRALGRLFYLSFFKRQDLRIQDRPRLPFCVKFFVLFPLVELFNWLCLMLDELVFPGCRRIPIRQPIFVIGPPRSGTTILHRVMARDEEHLFCFRTWEIAFPSLLQKRALSVVGRLDRLTGGHLRASLLRREAERFRPLHHIHEIGLFLPEEDDKLLAHVLASMDLAYFFPNGDFRRMAQFDVAVDPRDRRSIMSFYRRCLQRQAYFKQGSRTFLSKNPIFSGKVAALLEQFPDCRIIYLVRNPLDVVPSAISLVRAIVRAVRGVELDADYDEQAYEILRFFYTYPPDLLAALPEDRCMLLKYDDLIGQPDQVIRKIYAQFGLALTPEFEERLAQEVAKMKRHETRHEYALDRFSIKRDRIVADLRPIFERFGFDTREVG